MALLDRVEAGEFGNVVRSAGFCRLATRPHITAQWEHVGRMISLEPLTSDERLVEGEELLAVGQDIAFIGIDVDQDALAAALDDVALTDDELAEGPAAWAGFEDPFPVWQTASDWAD
jgi:G3E family GTPase